MKKLLITSLALMFSMTILKTQAQTKGDIVKTEIKDTKHQEKIIKKEKKAERKELRVLEGNKVNELAKTNFKTDFPGVSIPHWKRNSQFDEVNFTKDGQRMTAFYDYNSILVGTTQNKTFNDIPVKAQQIIEKKYKNYSIGTVVFFDDNESNDTDMILDGVQFDDEDDYFIPLTKDGKTTIVMSNTAGNVSYFTTVK